MRKLLWLLTAFAMMSALAAPVTPTFEVATIKLHHDAPPEGMGLMFNGSRFTVKNVPLKLVIQEAFHVKESQLSGEPAWVKTEKYDIEGKLDEATVEAVRKLGHEKDMEQIMAMMQALLADRFKLAMHHETKDLPVYVLVLAKNGPKFKETVTEAAGTPNQPRRGIFFKGRGQLEVTDAPLDLFANVLSMQLNRLVVNKTGLTAKYDFSLKWTPDENEGQMFKGAGAPPGEAPPPPDTAGPTIFTALQEQLGLKLEAQKSPTDTLVIDHIERPTEN